MDKPGKAVPANPPSSGVSDAPGWTPGPWAVVGAHKDLILGGTSPYVLIASIPAANTFGGLDQAGQPIWLDPTGEPLANAQLIATAPDLYAALQLYVDHFGDPLKVARPALAKARGEKP